MRYYYNKKFWEKVLDYLAATATTAPFLNAPTIGLLTGAPLLLPSINLADIAEPTFTGYNTQTMSSGWSARQNYGSGGTVIRSVDVITFAVATTGPAEVITGYWVQKTAFGDFMVCMFDEPVTLEVAGDALVLVPAVPILGPVFNL